MPFTGRVGVGAASAETTTGKDVVRGSEGLGTVTIRFDVPGEGAGTEVEGSAWAAERVGVPSHDDDDIYQTSVLLV